MKLVLAPGSPAIRAYGDSQPPVYQPPSGSDPFSVIGGGRGGGGVTNERGAFGPEGASRGNDQQSDTPSVTMSEGPIPSPPSFTTSTSIPRIARPATDPRPNDPGAERGRQATAGPGQTLVLSSRGRTDALVPNSGGGPNNSGLGSKLVIERGGRVGKEFAITGAETHIGRWDADSGIFPDVDLDQDDPEAKVSRRHARIINSNGQYFIEDLGSTNGTFINRGRRLLPGHRQMLQNGDEIIVGKTFLKFQILR